MLPAWLLSGRRTRRYVWSGSAGFNVGFLFGSAVFVLSGQLLWRAVTFVFIGFDGMMLFADESVVFALSSAYSPQSLLLLCFIVVHAGYSYSCIHFQKTRESQKYSCCNSQARSKLLIGSSCSFLFLLLTFYCTLHCFCCGKSALTSLVLAS